MQMKSKVSKMSTFLGIGSLCLFLLGCSDSQVVFEESTTENVSNSSEALAEETTLEEKPEADLQEAESVEEAPLFVVHICGAVQNPGVYSLEAGQRICHAVEAAGGFLPEAEEAYVNQAQMLEDGMKITIPTKEEVCLWEQQNQMGLESGTKESSTAGKDGQKVNINTADKTALCTLPGIGESRAESILAYREEHGRFKRIEDIMKVNGIKEAAFEKIKQYLTVS